MRTHAILPVKTFANAKQRLDDGLDAGTRRVIAQAMFSDVLVAMRRATQVDEIVVVTADDHAAQIAGGYGPRVRVLAVRLERAQDARKRWRCTAIESA